MTEARPEPAEADRRTPRLVTLLATFGVGLTAGAVMLGTAPWPGPAWTVASLILLAAIGAIPATTRTGIRGLATLYAGLLAGLAVMTWLRISLSESSFPGIRSLQPVAEWRLAYVAAVAAGLVLVPVGFLAGSRRVGPGRNARRASVVLGASLVGSVVIAGGLAIYLGTTALVIPEGAVILHVTMTDGMITLEPATVPADEIHFIRSQRGHRYEGPFLEYGTGPQGTAFLGPLTDADVAMLESGRLPDGQSVSEMYAGTPPGEPPPWPTPDEYGGHQRLVAGRYAWWTLEIGDFPGHARFRDLVFFTVTGD